MLAAVQSTEVPEEHDRDGLVAPQRSELDRLTLLVLYGQLREVVSAVQHTAILSRRPLHRCNQRIDVRFSSLV